MNETTDSSQENKPQTGDFDNAELYRELTANVGEHKEEPETIPRVTFEHIAQPDIPAEGKGYVAGTLAQADSNGTELQLSYAEAATAHHYQLAKKLWGNELAPGLQQIKAGEHEFGMISRYNIEPRGVYLQIVTNGDWDNQPAHSVVRQTIANVGHYLLTHPDNHSSQSTPHVTVSLSEGDNGNTLKTYNPRQLQLLKDEPTDEAA